ncbi:MAG: substrate-binding domain-containing protein [Alphaproteobacteria bacterium]|nr:substrate-binding domain-containing protein [Alphaproteobacteria bacterium]
MSICNSISAILNLVESGTGVSILPVRLVEDQVQTSSLQFLHTPSPLPMQDVFIGTIRGGAIVRALPQVV